MEKFLKVIREKRGLTQAELAERVGVTRCCISNIENGKRVASVELLANVCIELDFIPCVLMCDMMDANFPVCNICKNKDRRHLSPEERINLLLKEREDLSKRLELFYNLTSQNKETNDNAIQH